MHAGISSRSGVTKIVHRSQPCDADAHGPRTTLGANTCDGRCQQASGTLTDAHTHSLSLFVCVCVTPNYSTKAIVFAMIHHFNSFVSTAAVFSHDAPRGLSSISARQQNYVQPMHPYRALQPHMHAHSLRKGPHGRVCAGARRWSDRRDTVCVCVCVCVRYNKNRSAKKKFSHAGTDALDTEDV